MQDMIFLYRVKDTDDRDCCKYIKSRGITFECEHYFSSIHLEGSCFSDDHWDDYDDIETVLSEAEYNELRDYAEAISKLGYGIRRGDERYQKGLKLCEGIQHIYDKLNSVEAQEFYDEIVESEREYMKSEWNLDDGDIDDIFDFYWEDYRDRSIIGTIYDDVREFGEDEAYQLGYVDENSPLVDCIDFEKFGDYLIDDGNCYFELDDGRVVYLMC